MRFAGLLEPGTTLNYLTEGKYVRHSLIVVDKLTEIRPLLNQSQVLVKGTPIFVVEKNMTYIYNGDGTFTISPLFVLNENGKLKIKNSDGSLGDVNLDIKFSDLSEEVKEKLDECTTTEEAQTLINESLKDYVSNEHLTEVLNDYASWEELKNVVFYADIGENRKSIQLDNHNSLSGLDTNGTGYNLAMISKWNIADFGSRNIPINLNGSGDRPTYNDNKEIALIEDINSTLDGYNEELEKKLEEKYLKKEDANNTLKEIQDSLSKKEDTINDSNKVDAKFIDGLDDVAISGDYNDLINKIDVDKSQGSSLKMENNVISSYITATDVLI